MDNTIPPMTAPLGWHWSQPDPSEIELDDTHAMMSPHAFGKLKTYSSTIPTGVYPGKMWAAQVSHDKWELRWYGLVDGMPTMCSQNSREIIFL